MCMYVFSFWSLYETDMVYPAWLLHFLIASQHMYNSGPDIVVLSG